MTAVVIDRYGPPGVLRVDAAVEDFAAGDHVFGTDAWSSAQTQRGGLGNLKSRAS